MNNINSIISLCKKTFVAAFLCMSISGFGQEICNNGIDDDADGLIDLNDVSDCSCNTPPPAVTSIIPNPSFELMSACPNSHSQMNFVTDWTASCGTPDYLNTCGYTFPATGWAGLTPFPYGTGVAGEIFLQDYKENISCCLSSPMIAGTSYKINFVMASTAINSLNLNLFPGSIPYDPVDITIYGSTTCSTMALSVISPCPTSDPSWMQLGAATYAPTMSWQNMSITFTPTATINSIIVGAPCNLPPSYPSNSSPAPAYFPYFYFDNFILNTSISFGPSVNISSTGHYCTGDLMLKADISDTASLSTTLQWYHNGIAITGATGNTLNIAAGTAGLGNYQVWLNAGANCILSTKFNVTSSPPVISVNSLSVCPGSVATLSASSICTSYTWSTGATTSAVNVYPTAITNYTVVGSLGTCTSQAVSVVSIFPANLLVTGNKVICAGQSTTLTAYGATNFYWTDVSIPFTLNYNVSQAVIATPSVTTTYTVQGASGISPNTCLANAVVKVSIAPSPTITVTPNTSTICAGNAVNLNAFVTGANTYTWSNGATTASIGVFPPISTSYTVSSNIGACISKATATVTIAPDFSFSVSSPTVCSGQTATIIASGANSYTWASGSQNSYYTTTPLYSNTVYTVTGGNALNCKSIATATVHVVNPQANFSGLNEPVYTVGGHLQLTNQSTGASSYTWKLCDGVIASTTQLFVPLNDTGTCCITLIAYESLCVDSTTKCFQVVPEPSISIPNVFTPNGDHSNDVFKITSIGLKKINCEIYDRWGLKMHEWEGTDGFWNGTSQTGHAASGTYFYIVNYTDSKNNSQTQKGFLSLFRE
ncbi:MAG: gliding motility-associated C-terminal domain-containing protein [Bacteroidota bacterium]